MLKRFFTPKWQHQDFKVREQALSGLDASNDIDIIVKLAKDDPSSKIRELALAKLSDTATLESLVNGADSPIDWCRFAFRLNQVSPQIDKLVAEFIKVKDNWDKDETFKTIASTANAPELTNALLLASDDPDALFKIATTAKSIELRLKAVEEIYDLERLQQLSKKATHKQVLQLVRAKLTEAKLRQKTINDTIAEAERLTLVLEKLSQQSWFDPQYEVKVNHTVDHWRKLDFELVDSATQSQKTAFVENTNHFQDLLKTCQGLISDYKQELEQAATQKDALDKQAALCVQLENLLKEMRDPTMIDIEMYQSAREAHQFLDSNWRQTIQEVQPESNTLNVYDRLQEQLKAHYIPWENLACLKPEFEDLFKSMPIEDYGLLDSWLKKWQELNRKLAWPKSAVLPKLLREWTALAEQFQAQYDQIVVTQKKKARYLNQKISVLKKHCQQRNLIAANKLVNYINQKLNESIGDFRTSLAKKLEGLQPELNELRDWHAFATSPKKNELCDVMEQLINESIEPLERAKKVRAIQQQWRELLASDPQADDQLWDRFKKASDSAYLPCLDYYAEKDKVRSDNLKQRLRICESLEQVITFNGWTPQQQAGIEENSEARENSEQKNNLAELQYTAKQPDWKSIDKQINTATREWKKYQPVPENERQSIQEYFNTQLSTIRKPLDAEKQANLESRCELVEKAESFSQLDDIDKSIDGVLKLQKQWKELGITFYKADREQWKLFRQAIDKVFARRDSLKKQFKSELQNNQKMIKELTSKIEQLCVLDDKKLKQSYQQFEELKQSWSFETELPRASSQSLLNSFKKSCQKYQEHYAGLAQREKQLALTSLLAGEKLLQAEEENILQLEPPKVDESRLEQLKNELSELTLDKKGRSLLERRFNHLASIDPVIENRSGLKKLQEMALAMEILLAIDSPESCKEQRMAIQLEQLQKGLGSTQTDINKQKKVLSMFDVWVTIGLIKRSDRHELEARRTKIFSAVGL